MYRALLSALGFFALVGLVDASPEPAQAETRRAEAVATPAFPLPSPSRAQRPRSPCRLAPCGLHGAFL